MLTFFFYLLTFYLFCPEFLKVKKIPIEPFLEEVPQTFTNLLSLIKAETRQNRDLYLKSKIAFVSFIRGYLEHQCHYIFRIDQINFTELLRSFSVLHLPRMPELKNKKFEFEEDETKEIDIPFKEKKKEEERLLKLSRQKKLEKLMKENKEELWERAKLLKAKKIKIESQEVVSDESQTKDEADDENNETDDEDQINDDYKLLKKAKKRKISMKDFDHLFDGNQEDQVDHHIDKNDTNGKMEKNSKMRRNEVEENSKLKKETNEKNEKKPKVEKESNKPIDIDEGLIKLFLKKEKQNRSKTQPWSKKKEEKEKRKTKKKKNQENKIKQKLRKQQKKEQIK